MAIPARHADHESQFLDELDLTLRQALDAILEFTGATAGWIGLFDPDGRLYFPARAGTFCEAWLTLQQGQDSVWGFEVREGPILLEHPPPLAIFGEPPLQNLLGSLLRREAKRVGQLVLANKPTGFTSQDATALQTAAHLLSRQLAARDAAQLPLSTALLRRVLDQIQEGVLILDRTGRLVFANTVWGQWTGYATEELCDRPAPFPFWVSQADLALLGEFKPTVTDASLSAPVTGACRVSGAPAAQGSFLPFRHRDQSVFWRHVEMTKAEIGGQAVTIAFLRQQSSDHSGSGATPSACTTPALEVARPRPESEPTAALIPSVQTAGDCLSLAVGEHGAASVQQTKGMALLLRPDGLIDFWDEHWEELTGLTRQDLAEVPGELLLDWLLPQQRDRDFVADMFHLPARRPTQALLQVASRTGNRPLLCTFLPVRSSALRQEEPATTKCATGQANARQQSTDAWLIWACNPEITPTQESRVQRFLQQCLRGLTQLLNSFLTKPVDLAESALRRIDLPPEVLSWFNQILHSCMPAGRLIAALQDLASTTPGAVRRVALGTLVREFLEEYRAEVPEQHYDLELEVREPNAWVDANPRMLKVILRHLLTNAADAILERQHRQISVRVYGWEAEACCEVEDSGLGLSAADCTAVFAPFYSTKPPFGREAAHAGLDALGLGLTVSQHLAALHGGRLELRSAVGQGTAAALILPRREAVLRGMASAACGDEAPASACPQR